MKKIFYPIIPLLFALVSCSGWTEAESIVVEAFDLEKSNPELYAKYTEDLRRYKASDHKVTYATFENVDVSRNRSHHIASLPDSIDFIEIINPEYSGWLITEITKMRDAMGTRFILRISRDEILAAYDAFIAESETSEEAEQVEDAAGENIPYTDFESDYITSRLAIADEYGYDGICIAYSGSYTNYMSEEDIAEYSNAQNAYLSPIKAWISKNPGNLVFFEGCPQFLLEENRDILAEAEYIILPTSACTRIGQLDMMSLETIRDDALKECKFIYAVETLPYEEADVTTGRFLSGNQIEVSSQWLAREVIGYNAYGLAIRNVQRDYYNANGTYSAVRGAISTMNPNS